MPLAVILAGGQGERFWPLTHLQFPKYRIPFNGNTSLLQDTFRRLLSVYKPGEIHVVTTRAHADFVREELPRLKRSNLIEEPVRRNTAAAIYLSCVKLAGKRGLEEVVSFFPADHLIQDMRLFKKTVNGAVHLALSRRRLVTVGIRPTFPATGFGYIRRGTAIRGMSGAYEVRRFVEKPNRPRAYRYVREGSFFWNSGIFTWRIGIFLDAMSRFAPDFCGRFDRGKLNRSYEKLPPVSIDRALLEKTDNLALFCTRMDWCDMGSWDMLFDKAVKNSGRCHLRGLVKEKGSRDSLLLNESRLPLVALGISDLVVVQTERGTLVCRRGRAEEAALLAKK